MSCWEVNLLSFSWIHQEADKQRIVPTRCSSFSRSGGIKVEKGSKDWGSNDVCSGPYICKAFWERLLPFSTWRCWKEWSPCTTHILGREFLEDKSQSQKAPHQATWITSCQIGIYRVRIACMFHIRPELVLETQLNKPKISSLKGKIANYVPAGREHSGIMKNRNLTCKSHTPVPSFCSLQATYGLANAYSHSTRHFVIVPMIVWHITLILQLSTVS